MRENIATENLREVSSHFAFGKNWSSFAETITEDAISEATAGLSRLLSGGELKGASFFDIGCGSGLSMLAAERLGAAKVSGVDIDPHSVRTAEALLQARMPGGGWTVREKSVFELDPERDGRHDVVYSWGVLHHTGDVWPAIKKAAALVRPGGYLALALYRRTPLCGFWTREKRFYSKASTRVAGAVRLLYKTLYIAGLAATARNPLTYVRAYRSNRGMDWHHDVHDWLGGYPYQSVTPVEVKTFTDSLGFSAVRSFEKTARLKGFFGTHCDEFVMIAR